MTTSIGVRFNQLWSRLSAALPFAGGTDDSGSKSPLRSIDHYDGRAASPRRIDASSRPVTGPATYRAVIKTLIEHETLAKGRSQHANDIRDVIPHMETMLRESAFTLAQYDDIGMKRLSRQLMKSMQDAPSPLNSAQWIGLHAVNAKDVTDPYRSDVMSDTERFQQMNSAFQSVLSRLSYQCR